MTSAPPLRVSALVTTFDQARYLGEALECVLAQTEPPFEVVVVDDGSTDETPRVLESFGNHVRSHRQRNQGISAARNRALKMARGNAVAFLDGDDLWPNRSLEVRVKALEGDPSAGGVAGWVEQFVSPALGSEEDQKVEGAQEVEPPGGGPRFGRLAGSMLLRKGVFDAVGPFDTELEIGETVDWLARADAAGIRLLSVPEVVLRRRIHGENTVLKTENAGAGYLKVLRAAVERRRAGDRREGQG